MGMQLPPCRAITSLTIMHFPLGKRSGANQHDGSCNQVGSYARPDAQTVNPLSNPLRQETKAH